MTVIANAFPKCGTNLVKKALGAMGLKHHDGGMVRQNIGQRTRFVIPNGDGTKREEPINEVLGQENTFIHAHFCYGGDLPIVGAKMIFIHRNPRDAAISMLRTGKLGLQENKECLLQLIVKGAFAYGPHAQAWHNFMNWTAAPWVLSVRFDSICTDGGATIERMANYLGMKDVDSYRIASGLHGNGKQYEGRDVYHGNSTWTGRERSSWKDCGYWDDEVETAWKQTGGVLTERLYEYGG